MGHILSHMINPIFDLLVNNKSSKSILETLQKKYGGDDVGKKKYVVGAWLKFQMTDDKPIMDQVHQFENLTTDVLAEEMHMCEILQANVLIEKLPESWSNYRNHLKHKKRDMTLEELVGHMKIEEANRLKDKDSIRSSFSVKANLIEHGLSNRNKPQTSRKPAWQNKKPTTNFKRSGLSQKFQKGACYVCGKTGHKAYQCSQRRDQNHRDGDPKKNINLVEASAEKEVDTFAAVITEVNMVENNAEWIIDSGASKHFCASNEMFSELEEFEKGEQVFMGNSSSAPVFGKGKITLKLNSGKNLALSNVFFVPSLRRNLISAGLLNKAGLKLVMEADKLVFTKNSIFVGKGYLSGGYAENSAAYRFMRLSDRSLCEYRDA
ncbi:Retrovirus-related Pol polyprotein from transposon TNT 1-94 [Linum perenne]